jgi:hypothetical protein
MKTQIVTVLLVGLLTAPTFSVMQTGSSPREDVAMAAKGKSHHKHKHDKHKTTKPIPTPAPVSRTVRQSVTQTFTSTGRIAVPNDSDMIRPTFGKASPYPSTIDVSGFTNGVITDVNLTLTDVSHRALGDVDVLLSKEDRQALVMSDVSFQFGSATDVDLNLDDEAAASLPDGQLPMTSGTFRPTNVDARRDTFDAPAPTPNGAVALSTFDGADPNGTWQLWVMDNADADVGEIGGGWSLEITAAVDVPAQAQAQRHPKSKATKHVQPAVPRPEARRSEG